MTPDQLAAELNRLAHYVDTSKNPSRIKVASDLRAAMHLAGMSHEAGIKDLLTGLQKLVSKYTGLEAGLGKAARGNIKELKEIQKNVGAIESLAKDVNSMDFKKAFGDPKKVDMFLAAFTDPSGQEFAPNFSDALKRSGLDDKDKKYVQLKKVCDNLAEVFNGDANSLQSNASYIQTNMDSIRKLNQNALTFLQGQITSQLNRLLKVQADQISEKKDSIDQAIDTARTRARPEAARAAPPVSEAPSDSTTEGASDTGTSG